MWPRSYVSHPEHLITENEKTYRLHKYVEELYKRSHSMIELDPSPLYSPEQQQKLQDLQRFLDNENISYQEAFLIVTNLAIDRHEEIKKLRTALADIGNRCIDELLKDPIVFSQETISKQL